MNSDIVDYISQKAHERRENGESFITKDEHSLLSSMIRESEMRLPSLIDGLKGLGEMMTGAMDSNWHFSNADIGGAGQLLTETTRSIEDHIYVIENAKCSLKHPIQEESSSDKAFGKLMRSIVLYASPDAKDRAFEELSGDQLDKTLVSIFSKLPDDGKQKMFKEMKKLVEAPTN